MSPDGRLRDRVELAARDALERRAPGTVLAVAARRRGRNRVVVSGDTRVDVLVEGFPRSGNSFVVGALRSARPDLVVASHVHSAAHVAAAVQRGIPTVVLVRDPRDAVGSLAHMGGRSAWYLASRYVSFHEQLLALNGADLLVIPFDEAIGDVEGTVARVLLRSGVEASARPSDATLADRALEDVKRQGVARHGRHDSRLTSVPDADRRAAVDQVLAGVSRDVEALWQRGRALGLELLEASACR